MLQKDERKKKKREIKWEKGRSGGSEDEEGEKVVVVRDSREAYVSR